MKPAVQAVIDKYQITELVGDDSSPWGERPGVILNIATRWLENYDYFVLIEGGYKQEAHDFLMARTDNLDLKRVMTVSMFERHADIRLVGYLVCFPASETVLAVEFKLRFG